MPGIIRVRTSADELTLLEDGGDHVRVGVRTEHSVELLLGRAAKLALSARGAVEHLEA